MVIYIFTYIAIKQYYYSNDKVTWDEARAYCKNKGAQLVDIASAQENEVIFKTIK